MEGWRVEGLQVADVLLVQRDERVDILHVPSTPRACVCARACALTRACVRMLLFFQPKLDAVREILQHLGDERERARACARVSK